LTGGNVYQVAQKSPDALGHDLLDSLYSIDTGWLTGDPFSPMLLRAWHTWPSRLSVWNCSSLFQRAWPAMKRL